MRTIRHTTRFKRDYKREAKGVHRAVLDQEMQTVATLLAQDRPLPIRYRDHSLSGAWKDCRDCHIRPDLVLIYRKPDPRTVELVRLGSHSELGL